MPTRPKTAVARKGSSKDGAEAFLCALSYLFPVWIFGLFFIRRSKRIHFHVFQAINLSATMLIDFIFVGIIGFFVNMADWRYSNISGILSAMVVILYAALVILAIARVIRRNNRPLPLVIRFVRPR